MQAEQLVGDDTVHQGLLQVLLACGMVRNEKWLEAYLADRFVDMGLSQVAAGLVGKGFAGEVVHRPGYSEKEGH